MTTVEIPEFIVPQVPSMPANHSNLKNRVAIRNSALAYLKKKRLRMVEWRMHLSIYEIDNRIHQLRVFNKVDRELTYWFREEVKKEVEGSRKPVTSVEVFTKRGELINKFNYEFSKEEEAKLCRT